MKTSTKILAAELGLVALVLVAPLKKGEFEGTYLGRETPVLTKDAALNGWFSEKPVAKFDANVKGDYLPKTRTFPASEKELESLTVGEDYNISQRGSILFNYSTRYSPVNN